ncbi:hypothetical protein [Synechocystis sp. PCC 7509]|nr:hypothetical protein [Synechocystis sp. PCC 7509]
MRILASLVNSNGEVFLLAANCSGVSFINTIALFTLHLDSSYPKRRSL